MAGISLLLVGACGAPQSRDMPAPEPEASRHPAQPPVPAAGASAIAPPQSSSASPEASAPEPGPNPAQAAATKFPPEPFPAPHERTARPGDGVWVAIAEAADADAAPAIVRSTVHPHPFKRFTSVELAAIDLQRVDVRLVAGSAEPESSSVPAERRTGLVPPEDLGALVAVFNGGFQARHGHYGMRIGNDVFLPARDESCTFGLNRDGTVVIGTWQSVREREPSMLAWRQTPPCLLENGVPNPSLDSSNAARKWGISIEGKLEIRRSAIGIDASGRSLIFGIGEEVTPRDIAGAMQAAGAVSAAELDINWSYTRFLIYRKPADGTAPGVVWTLLPKMKYGKQEYVTRPAPRDFFYVRRKKP